MIETASHEGVRITLEEWFGDNNIPITDEQIIELQEAIEMSYEMEFVPDRYSDIKREENTTIKALERQIDLLTGYLGSLGHDGVYVANGVVKEVVTRNYGGLCSTSTEVVFL